MGFRDVSGITIWDLGNSASSGQVRDISPHKYFSFVVFTKTPCYNLSMILKGKARKFKINDDINTDYIISGRYKFKIQDPKELAQHVMEDLDPDFSKKVQKGDFIVAGKNFGCGSSREQAPQAIKYAGISAVLASSFARIFYRNSFNLGLPSIECQTDSIDDGDELEVDLEKGLVKNITKGSEIKINPLPKIMQKLLADGGLVEHFKKYGGFSLG